MPAEIGVLVVHGMGRQRDDFAATFIGEMDGRLDRLGLPAGAVHWRAGYWADLLNTREEALWAHLSSDHKLDFTRLRRFFISAFGDAVAYRRGPAGGTDVYAEIHGRIRRHLRALRATLGDANRPLVVVAHSLGSVIISDYIWDAQSTNGRARGENAFECMETLAGLVTFGSNIPLFSLALPRIESITFPPPALPEPLRSAARWLNLYDADDVLGWPLRPLSPSYAAAVSEDREINVGGIVTSWNPLSHDAYWTDDDFAGPVAELIRDVVLASREVAPAPALATSLADDVLPGAG